MLNADKVLVVTLAHASLLLPEWVLPDNDRSHPFLCQEVNDALTGGGQVVMNLSVARVGDAFHLLGHTLSLLFGKSLLVLLHALIIPLVPRFYPPTVNQARDKPLSVASYPL